MPLRVSTFNCENLLSRAKILNLENGADARKPLADLATLEGILGQAQYSEDDKKQILGLIKALKGFAEFAELRNALVGRRKVGGKTVEYVKPNGRGEWVGGLSLLVDPLPTAAQANTARVIAEVGADVQCLVEVEDRLTVERFSGNGALRGLYPYNLVLDGNDQRGIDVGLLSKYPLGRIRTHVFDTGGKPKATRVFSRDCLEVEVLLPGGQSLFILLNHFKSQGYGARLSNDARRKAQAARVVEILGGYDLAKQLVIVAGDLNDKPDGAPIAGLVSLKGLVDVLAWKFQDPKDRWTYVDKSQIDYLLVSKPLAAKLSDAGIERRGMFNLQKLTKGAQASFDTVTSDTNDASDHAAVWAEFDL
jgi:endonuclease/exonuclease/phosphatase family metal-dependent hydrolase